LKSEAFVETKGRILGIRACRKRRAVRKASGAAARLSLSADQ